MQLRLCRGDQLDQVRELFETADFRDLFEQLRRATHIDRFRFARRGVRVEVSEQREVIILG